jgi:cell wall-associated NlpC family hydrolase
VRGKALVVTIAVLGLMAVAVAPAWGQDPVPAPTPATGGTAYGEPAQPAQPAQPVAPTVPGLVGQVVDGVAHAPDQAPDPVKQAISAANQIIGLPYVYGGGHGLDFTADGYDCSGTVSFALHGANLLAVPRDSSQLMRFGAAGRGQWITVYSNPGHAFAVIAGLRLDTSAAGDPSGAKGPRWRPNLRSTRGYQARHPVGL